MSDEHDQGGWLTVQEYMERTGYSRPAIYQRCKAGKIKAYKPSGRNKKYFYVGPSSISPKHREALGITVSKVSEMPPEPKKKREPYSSVNVPLKEEEDLLTIPPEAEVDDPQAQPDGTEARKELKQRLIEGAKEDIQKRGRNLVKGNKGAWGMLSESNMAWLMDKAKERDISVSGALNHMVNHFRALDTVLGK